MSDPERGLAAPNKTASTTNPNSPTDNQTQPVGIPPTGSTKNASQANTNGTPANGAGNDAVIGDTNGDSNGIPSPAAEGAPPEEVRKKANPDSIPFETMSGEKKEVDFKHLPLDEAFMLLRASEKGLSSDEHAKRLEKYGPNKLPEKRRNPVLVYLGYMNNPLSWAMEAAAIIAICLLDFADFGLILGLLFLNATISYVEESNAEKAIKALTAALAPRAKVLRDGEVKQIDATDLVPGDVIVVRIGDVIPADVKLLGEADQGVLQVDEAALTGESLPVKKGTGNVAFSGSSVKQGERHALVYATGPNTFFGRVAALISGTQNVANIQKIMTRIGACCLATIALWIIIELPVQFAYYKHSCKAGMDRCPVLTNMLVIVVGGIPIAMPTVLSVTLALGAAKLAKEGAIVARISAVEEMAGMDVLCSDKTGTLTLNKLSINGDDVMPTAGHTPEEVMKFASLSAQKNSEEAIDVVLIDSYPGKETLWNEYSQDSTIPFNPVDKYTIAYLTDKSTGKKFQLLKGAPQVVLKRSVNNGEIGNAVNAKIEEFASRGFRALGIARAEGGAENKNPQWEMLGLLPLFDPPRHDTKPTIEECIRKGIAVKMVTGDQGLIAKEVARQLGLGTNIYPTEVLLRAKEGDFHVEGVRTPAELVEHADGFAEVFPEHKYNIVEILQQGGAHMVGMTGDGVNDAPALKKADVGIAVAGATEAARGAADIVLTEAGLSTIVTAIIGARKIFQRMTTYAKYTVAMTFRICFTFGMLSCVYNWYFSTLLTVLLAVFNDGAMIALAKDRVQPSATPNAWRLMDIFITGIVYGIYLALSSWVLFYVAAKTTFFRDSIHMFDLNTRTHVVNSWCYGRIASFGYTPQQPACDITQYKGAIPCDNGQTILAQCVAEQRYTRESMLRTLMYLQVSISGQALVFVVRTTGLSWASRAGLLTYVAFFGAQILATIIALFGFNGYDYPADNVHPCIFCALSSGGYNPFWSARRAPRAGTESVSVDSIIGCEYYVVVAWIWSFIWHLPLDLIKWVMAWILNEDGFRDRAHWLKRHRQAQKERRAGPPPPDFDRVSVPINAGQGNWHNPMGRVSVTRPTQVQLDRASVVSMADLRE